MIVSVILAVAICVVAYFVYVLFDKVEPNTDCVYSFNEAMETVELPVLTMYNNNKRLKFILDSGSNSCHIDKNILDKLELEDTQVATDSSETATGGGLISTSQEKCTVRLLLKNTEFNVPFLVEDLKVPFDFIKKQDGIQLHGILGSNFLSANGWVLDFAENIAYMKHKK